jgi:uncharacterized protein (TIGR03067 family)
MTRALMTLTMIGLVAGSSALADDKNPAGKDALAGTWKLTSVEINGQPLSMEKLQEARLVVEGAKYSLVLGETRLEMTHVLHVDKAPKEMELSIAEGPDKGKVFPAIYKLEGDKLTVCRNITPGKERPTEFATKPDTGLMLVVWTRNKS